MDTRKMLVKKRIQYRNSNEHALILQKVDKLKTLSHRNCINIRKVEDSQPGSLDLYYPYVPHRLEDVFGEDTASVKDLHKQFI